MKESTTYQAILQEGEAKGEARGRVREAREILVELGTPHLGEPDAATLALIEAITDLPRLRELRHQVQTATSWANLLGTPPTPPRRRGRRWS